ncbi:MAG: M1 family metallopeptidase, partial [Planctomycetota bacterium]
MTPRPLSVRTRLGSLLCAAALALPGAANAQSVDPVPPIPEAPEAVIDWDLRVTLDAEKHTLDGAGTMTWRNTGPGEVDSLWMHLYLNAFRNDLSTFMKGVKGSSRASRQDREKGWGWIDLTEAKLENGSDLLPSLTFEAPDDGNGDDRTVVRMDLPEPVAEGGAITVKLGWKAQLPKVWRRTGWHRDFHLVAQWFPKPGVRREKALRGRRVDREGWDCPTDHLVGATGRESSSADNHDGSKTRTFEQRSVIDFTWMSAPGLHVEKRTWRYTDDPDPAEETRLATAFGRKPEIAGSDAPVEVLIIMQPEHADLADRVYDAVSVGLKYLGLRFGPYPYETLTVIDPPQGGPGAGGMEYPTLFTIGSPTFAHHGVSRPEGVTVHEFAHQFFAMMLASHEARQAWLDEGLTTYVTARAMESAWPGRWRQTSNLAGIPVDGVPVGQWGGLALPVHTALNLPAWAKPGGNALLSVLRDAPPSNLLPGIVRSPFDRDRERSLSIREVDPIDRPGWTFMTSRHYGSNTYSRTSATLRSLERHLGRDVLDRGLRIYAARQRYRHPVAEDLFDALSEAAGRNLRPLLHHLFREPLRHDAMVQSVKVHRVGDEKGWFEAAGGGRELRVGSKDEEDEEDKDENGDSGDGGEQR